jgi:hypothetical protein
MFEFDKVLINPEDIRIGDVFYKEYEEDEGRWISIDGRFDIHYSGDWVFEFIYQSQVDAGVNIKEYYAKLYTDSINDSKLAKLMRVYNKRKAEIRAIKHYVDFEEEHG